MSISDSDIRWMRLALEEAAGAARGGEAPVGAVVARGEELLARAHDERQRRADPTAHAEILALRAAGERLGDWRLDGCDLYVTLEPCPMCAGAAVMARIRRLVYGAANRKAGAVETHCRTLDVPTFNHRVEVLGGVEAEAASALLSAFFAQWRKKREDSQ
ncbi:MAG: tRNA adenosine(34) deaminase TadA [Candidatus Sumerlaeota bacterium]|nr:tRNA adenosine(34) deaminase TadA [Candidatus Sumerlaeota bacterium]